MGSFLKQDPLDFSLEVSKRVYLLTVAYQGFDGVTRRYVARVYAR